MRWIALSLALLATPIRAEVPIDIAASGHAVVPVEGSFGVRAFVFDTGAEGTAVYASFASEAGLQPVGTSLLQGQTGATDATLLRLNSLSLDGVAKGPIDAIRLDPRADGVPLAGIVGLDLFGDRVVDFDLPRRRLDLLEPGKHPIAGKGIVATPTTGDLLTIPVTIGSVTATAVIDTGARKTRINWNLARRVGIDPASLSRGDTIGGATNTAIESSAATLANVCVGQHRLQDVPVLVADLPVFDVFGVADKPAVILGLDWLEELRMLIDFPARRVWFERSPVTKSQRRTSRRSENATRAESCRAK